jgi:glycogen operon protein
MGTVIQEGRPWPMGAHCEGGGVNIAVFSAHAHQMELCLYDETGQRETARIALAGHSGDVWHAWLPGAAPGLVYGLRAHGAWRAEEGHRFNPHKLLLDPYAREIVGRFEWRGEHFGADAHGRMDLRDNGAYALKARVVQDNFDWGDDRPPLTPLADTVLYEAHVKGLTKLHPGVAPALRGTYAGLCSDAAIEHLRRLGITAVSLLPVHQRLDEQRLVERGLTNHWGYNPIGFFAVEPRLASAGANARDEFRTMVKGLHAAGLEVILDVVFNHTAETDEAGPTISWRGLDNHSYYRTRPGHPGVYDNLTGCGNTLDLRHRRVLQMVMDSLRYWVQQMHVDGFRFDLAPVLARGDHGFDACAPFFHAVAQDPVLQRVKLIAEPWDLGPGGYRLGDFPRGWLEWNDRFRDAMRVFWLRGGATRGEFARRLCSSSDLFHKGHRQPVESVNFIVAHDGFTLRDLVSHDHRHNAANGEANRDGHHANHSWNCGVEGDTDDPAIRALRARLQRALLATLLLAQGTPMLCAGDELGHSQRGNNNAYSQDNETSWIDWSRADAALIAFTARVLALRRELRPLAAHWYSGRPGADGEPDLSWWDGDGMAMHGDAWDSASSRMLGARIGTSGLMILVNPHPDARPFVLPARRWRVLLDTADETRQAEAPLPFPMAARSLVLLSERA